MEQLIGCDAHKKFSVFSSIDEKGVYGRSIRVGHDREVFRKFLRELPAGSQIELETRGWPAAWPLLGSGTLSDVWIPPAALGDQRELLRWGMFLSQPRARLKNRIQAVLQRYSRTVG
jgi:hypothetical protein